MRGPPRSASSAEPWSWIRPPAPRRRIRSRSWPSARPGTSRRRRAAGPPVPRGRGARASPSAGDFSLSLDGVRPAGAARAGRICLGTGGPGPAEVSSLLNSLTPPAYTGSVRRDSGTKMTKKRNPARPLSENKHLLRWVDKMADLCKPDSIHWVDGSKEEYDALCRRMVASGPFIKLNEKLWPGCYYARSDPTDVARVEDRTFICSHSREAAGPTNNWVNPFEMRRKLRELFSGAMRGRTMYVLPFSMGPVGSPMAKIGVQLTDSPYVVANMRIMARIGLPVYAIIDKGEKRVVPCMHSVGAPLAKGAADVP